MIIWMLSLRITDKSFTGKKPPDEINENARFNKSKILINKKSKVKKIKILIL